MPSYKVIKSGHIVEVYKYQSGITRRFDDDMLSRKGGRDKEGCEGRKMEYQKRTQQNAYTKLRRLINANFDQDSLFVTLTFRDDIEIDAANYELKKFMQKMKRRQSDFKYVAVIEFTKKGRPHYHMLCNYMVSWSTHEELQNHERVLADIWGHGFVDIGYKKNDNAGAYLLKYMTKDSIDERLAGKKRYFYSRNLIQPVELTGGEALQVLKDLEGLPPVFTSEYFSDFDGQVQFKEYNPKRFDYDLFRKESIFMQDRCLQRAVDLFGDIVEEVHD